MIGKEAFKAVGSFIFRALELALALGLQVIFKKQTGASYFWLPIFSVA